MRVFYFLILFCFVFWSPAAVAKEAAQTSVNEAFTLSRWTTEEGLPQNSVSSIIQTKDGYVWLATAGGLARFDGIKFKIFNTANTPELKSNRITALYEAPNGILWIGAEAGDIVNYENGVFKYFAANAFNSEISSFYAAAENRLWVGTNHGLKRYDLINDTWQRTDFDELPSTLVRSICGDATGNIWFGFQEKGLFRFSQDTFTLLTMADGLPDNDIHLVKVSGNKLWIISKTAVSYYLNDKFTKAASLTLVPFESIAFDIDRQENVWFQQQNSLLHINTNNEMQLLSPKEMKYGADSLLIDREGNIWIGTKFDGLICLKKRFIHSLTKIDGQEWMNFNAIIEDKENKIWFGTDKLIGLSGGETTFYLDHAGKKISHLVKALANDADGKLWIATDNGLFTMQGGKITQQIIPGFMEGVDPPVDYSILSLFVDRRGRLWIGKRSGGLIVLENGSLKTYNPGNGLLEQTVHYITETRDGAIWIGTTDGLTRFKDEVFTHFTTADGLSNNYVRDIFEDDDGSLWIGTYGGGLNHWQNGIFTAITTKIGLFDDFVSRILPDDFGNFWILGNRGIFSVNRKLLNGVAAGSEKTVVCAAYGIADGMSISEGNGGNQPAGWRTHDGKLWFPMIRGAVVIDPQQANSTALPNVVIEDVLLNNEMLDSHKTIEIQPGQENLEIHYTGLSFAKPEQTQFRYKLEGLENEWNDAGTRRVAYFPHLPPGKYKFLVKSVSANGIWSENPATVEIQVFTPFWRSWGFGILVFAAIICVVVFVYQFRLGQIERARLVQQNFARRLINVHESERQRIAAELHDSLGQDLLIIKNWALLGLDEINDSKQVKTQLTEISETASHAIDEVRTIARNLRPNHMQRFGLTATLKNVEKQIETFSQINLTTEIDEIDGIFTPEAELSIYRIVQESLNNIIKHAAASEAQIRLTRSKDFLILVIADNGKGFTNEFADVNFASNESFGLTNIVERVKILGGKYTMQSKIGDGTKIIISLPIKNER